MTEAASPTQKDYVQTITERLEAMDCTDQFGNPVGALSAAEKGAVLDFTLKMGAGGQSPVRCALELEAGVRKYVVLYGALLPLIKADAERTGRKILLLAGKGNRDARAQNEFRAMSAVTLGTHIKFGTWDSIESSPENGFKSTSIRPYWVIGDMDVDKPLEPDYITDAKRRALHRVLHDGACPVLLLHQKDETTIDAFPPKFSSEPAANKACFIATAACGSAMAPEVELLRGFRDEVLARRAMGRAFVSFYDRWSPPLAGWIAGRNLARKVVRASFIRPLAWVVARGRKAR